MATETDHLHHYNQAFGDNWSCPEVKSESEESQATSISQILDHGSVSFGRYAVETLAWEKYSVFLPNRCQEEMEQFKAPGLVAQKKAYFEKYYKKVRAKKELQAEQAITHSDPFQDGQQSPAQVETIADIEEFKEECKRVGICQEENGVGVDMSKQEKKPSNVDQIRISENDTSPYFNSFGMCIHDCREQQSYSNGNRDTASTTSKHSMKKVPSSCIPSVKGSSGIAHKESRFSKEGKHNRSQPKKEASATRTKGTVASAANRTKLDCRVRKDMDKPSEKPKPSSHTEMTSKRVNSSVSGKRVIPTTASNTFPNRLPSHRQLREIQSTSMVLHSSFMKDKKVSSHSSDTRGGQLKMRASPKSLPDHLPAKSSVLTRSAQSSNKEVTTICRLRTSSVHNRRIEEFGKRSLELSGHQRLPKSREAEDQRQKVMSKNISARSKSHQNIGLESGHSSSILGCKQKKEVNEINAGIGSKPASSNGTGIQNVSKPKLMPKIAPSLSVDLMPNQKDSRMRMPVWR